MNDRNTAVDDGGGLNPQALSVDDAVRVLSAAGRRQVSADAIRKGIEDGAPTNPDGTINLVNYAAWMVKEMGRGN